MSSPSGAECTPDATQTVIEFFERSKVWFSLTRNTEAGSCRDAAFRRIRLGVQGIPLYDELRSWYGLAYFADGTKKTFLCHCRADRHFDLGKVALLLGTTDHVIPLSATDLAALNMEYGTVNPFSAPPSCIQIFDDSITETYTPPHTMMTNAGERTWAIEFDTREVLEALRRTGREIILGTITTTSVCRHQTPIFGIITGSGTESGIALWRQMNCEIVRHFKDKRVRGPICYPKVVMYSIPEICMPIDLRQRRERLWPAIKSVIRQLLDCGVTHLAIASTTLHAFSDRIRIECGTKAAFVSIVDVIYNHMLHIDATAVTMIASAEVCDMSEDSVYYKLVSLGVQPLNQGVHAQIDKLRYLVNASCPGRLDPQVFNLFREITNKAVRTPHMLVALSEMSVILQQLRSVKRTVGDKIVIDSLNLYGGALAQLYLDALPAPNQREAV